MRRRERQRLHGADTLKEVDEMTMAVSAHYVIRGGVEGRARLSVLARVMRETTVALLTRLGVGEGLNCLDAGCGGGDVTLELARRVAPGGRVVGVDIDETTLELARREAAELGFHALRRAIP